MLINNHLQEEREEAVQVFRYGIASVLVATDVAARGLDVPEVSTVINYDLPHGISEYIYRHVPKKACMTGQQSLSSTIAWHRGGCEHESAPVHRFYNHLLVTTGRTAR